MLSSEVLLRAVIEMSGKALTSKPVEVQHRIVRDAGKMKEELIAGCEGQIQAVADALRVAPTHMLTGEVVAQILSGLKSG